MLDKIERFSRTLSRWFEVVGAAAIFLMMVVTCIDVVGAKIFLRPLPGAFDFTVLGQLISSAFAAAFVLVLGMHVKVDFFAARFPKNAQTAMNIIVHFLSLILFILIMWRLTLYGSELRVSREVSSEIRIPLYPFAYMIAFATIPVCLLLVVRFLRSLAEVFRR